MVQTRQRIPWHKLQARRPRYVGVLAQARNQQGTTLPVPRRGVGRLGKHPTHRTKTSRKSPKNSPLRTNRCRNRTKQRERQRSQELARRAQNTIPTIRTRPRMERQDLSKLRRLHRRRPGTDALDLAQPENVGNTIQPAMEQDSPRTTPNLQSRKLDRNLKTARTNPTLRFDLSLLTLECSRSMREDIPMLLRE